MDSQDPLMKGGLKIAHNIHEGKHRYEVRDVVKFKKNGGKAFAREGDTLVSINQINLENLKPEEFAHLLTKGNPKLILHHADQKEDPASQPSPAEGEAFYPVSKENTLLHFSLEMRREEEGAEWQEGEGMGGGGEEEGCPGESGEEGEAGVLLVTMTSTSITVLTGRGCDAASPAHNCIGADCTFKQVVMVATSSKVTFVPSGAGSFKKEKQIDNISIEHVVTQQYLRSVCVQNSLYMSPNPEKITIYYYKSDRMEQPFRGMPVVVNFTDSNCFLKCCKDGERVLLQVETCPSQRLKLISKGDDNNMSFVFYMKATKTRSRRFESARFTGWFIHIADTNAVEMGTTPAPDDDPTFYFIIQK